MEDLQTIITKPNLNLQVPRLDEYFGLWAMHEPTFRQLVDSVQGMNLLAHVQVNQESNAFHDGVFQATKYDKYGSASDIAIINVSGPMMKFVSSMAAGTSTVSLRRQIRAAAKDPEVSAILLVIDSPGGTVSGTYDLADDVKRAQEQKPVWAYVEDLGASAAYAVAASTGKIYANSTALVGSIGTYAVITDTSGMAEDLKVKVRVVRPNDGTSQFKGMGTGGTEVTEEQLDEMQRIVTQLNAFFLDTVSSGRSLAMDKVKSLADGRVHIAADAASMNLIDGVRTLDETLAEISNFVTDQRERTRQMSEENKAVEPNEQPKPATIAELKDSLPGASSDFIIDQLEKGHTVEQAKSDYIQELALEKEAMAEEDAAKLKAEREAREKAEREAAEAKQAAEERKKESLGVEGVESGHDASTATGDVIEEWQDLVREQIEKGKTLKQATMHVSKHHPELRQAYVIEFNRQQGRNVA